MASDSRLALDTLWPGPRPYAEHQSAQFVGRDEEIRVLLERVLGQRLSVYLAPSAAGKTSVLQAGLIPELRYMRLEEVLRAQDGEAVEAQFPLLLNQWIGRAGAGVNGDFSKLVLVEAHRYARGALAWYRAEKEEAVAAGHANLAEAIQRELDAIDVAAGELQNIAERGEFAALDTTGTLELIADSAAAPVEDSEMTDLLLDIQGALCSALGNVLLVFDQFEEVLGDAVLGRQAVVAVEGLFKLCPDSVRQLISMRNDSKHLLEPMEARGTLERKRLLNLYPFAPKDVENVIDAVSGGVDVVWEPNARAALVGAFTDTPTVGRGRRDVNLLGLQIVLRELFSQLERIEDKTVSLETLRALSQRIKGTEISDAELETWLAPYYTDGSGEETVAVTVALPETKVRHRARLAEQAPREWIEKSLAGDVGDPSQRSVPDDLVDGAYEPGLIKPMVARMAAWLVTPAGFKRPMTGEELRKIAFEKDFDDLDESGDFAGRAVTEGWSGPQVRAALDATFRVAMYRLVELGHVLKGRGSETHAKYELVHDQFGRPLQTWAEEFNATPEANLSLLYATDDKRLPWGRRNPRESRIKLLDSLTNAAGSDLVAMKWRGCVIEGVDFSGVHFKACDFSRTVFVDCLFDAESTFSDGCELVASKFDRCEMRGTKFTNVNLESAWVADGSVLENVTFSGGSLKSVNFRGACFLDCTFEGAEGAPVRLTNAEIVGCSLKGTTTLRHCALDGATIGADPDLEDSFMQPGRLVLEDCGLKGVEFTSIHFGDSSLHCARSVARGAVFLDVTFAPRADVDSTAAVFEDVDLTGSVFIACELRNAEFRSTSQKTSARTVVFRSGPDQAMELSHVKFIHQDMENFSFVDCVVSGPIEFSGCELSGGTISADDDLAENSSRLHGNLQFCEKCDLTALEMRGLDFAESTLEVRDSLAASLYFEACNFPRMEEGWRVTFEDCAVPGLMFQGCQLHSMHVGLAKRKREDAPATAIIVRGGALADSERDAADFTFGGCTFAGVDMENFTFEKLTIDGDISFSNCALSGGTITGIPEGGEVQHQHLRLLGRLSFTDSCEMSALELNSVVFDGGTIFASGSACAGMAMIDVEAVSEGPEPAIEFDDCDLSGAVVLGCDIRGLRLLDTDDVSSLSRGWGLNFSQGTRLGDAQFVGYNLDGFVMQSVAVTGPVLFERCSLLRSLFSDCSAASEDAYVDIRDAVVLFAQIDPALLGASPDGQPGRVLRINPDQWEIARAAAALVSAQQSS